MTPSRYANEQRFSLKLEIAKYVISAFIVGAGVGVLFFLRSLATPPETAPSTALIQQVDTFQIQPYSGILDKIVTGTVVPHREIKLAAEVGGRIKKKFDACQAGTYVHKGEPLVKIDPEEYLLEIQTLEADVAQSLERIKENQQQIAGEKRNIKLAESDLQIQKNEFDRNQRLANVLSQSELDQSRRALNSAKTQLVMRENNLATLEATTDRLKAAQDFSQRKLEKAKLNLRRTLIVAPDDGVIVKENAQEGDYVAPGTHIVIFEDTDRAEVLCNLTPGELEWIRQHSTLKTEESVDDPLAVYSIPKTEISIFDPADPTVIWQGILERFDGIGRDAITKTIPCRIVVTKPVIDTPGGRRALVRGLYVKCRIEVHASSDQSDSRLVIFPAVGLHPDDHVWKVVDKKLKRVAVQVVDRGKTTTDGQSRKRIIAKNRPDLLEPGDLIVVSPLLQPIDDSPVLIRQAPSVKQKANQAAPED